MELTLIATSISVVNRDDGVEVITLFKPDDATRGLVFNLSHGQEITKVTLKDLWDNGGYDTHVSERLREYSGNYSCFNKRHTIALYMNKV